MLLKFILPRGALLASFAQAASATVQGVFAHYLVGTITSDHAQQDITDAKAAGFDAFALDLLDSEPNSYATTALAELFQAADDQEFKLFFSLDLANLNDPSQFMPIVQNYSTHASYYNVSGKPFLSTFSGGTQSFGSSSVNDFWTSAFQQYSLDPFFVPNLDNAPNYPTNFFSTFPIADGAFGWESAWPAPDSPAGTNVSSSVDAQVIEQAHAADKVYMMPWSSLQYKNLPGSFYYRIGESTLGQRVAQILSSAPDFVELITWNDSGESHYVGDFWPEAIVGTNIPNYAIFDHTGWQKLIAPVIASLKDGATDPSQIGAASGTSNVSSPTGAIWYRSILTTNPCPNGKPSGVESAEDAVNYAIILPQGSGDGVVINVYSNEQQIGSAPASSGLNTATVLGLTVGSVAAEVVDGASGEVLASINGTTPVSGDPDPYCNYNYVVVGL